MPCHSSLFLSLPLSLPLFLSSETGITHAHTVTQAHVRAAHAQGYALKEHRPHGSSLKLYHSYDIQPDEYLSHVRRNQGQLCAASAL